MSSSSGRGSCAAAGRYCGRSRSVRVLRVDEREHPTQPRDEAARRAPAAWRRRRGSEDPGQVSARVRQALDQAVADRIGGVEEDDRGCGPSGFVRSPLWAARIDWSSNATMTSTRSRTNSFACARPRPARGSARSAGCSSPSSSPAPASRAFSPRQGRRDVIGADVHQADALDGWAAALSLVRASSRQAGAARSSAPARTPTAGEQSAERAWVRKQLALRRPPVRMTRVAPAQRCVDVHICGWSASASAPTIRTRRRPCLPCPPACAGVLAHRSTRGAASASPARAQ